VLQGQQDMVCSAAAVDTFAGQMPMTQLVKLPKVGHGFGVERNWLPQFLSAYEDLRSAEHARTPHAVESSLLDLPLIEVPSRVSSGRMALLMTGDGGWAGLDQELAERLAANAVPVVGLNSLKYFWKERTPEETAADVTRVLRHYVSAWGADHILLVGYSFGAEVLPFVANRLPADLRERVQALDLLGPGTSASFEIHVTEWLPGVTEEDGTAIAPEVLRLKGIAVLCIHGSAESDSLCPLLPADRVTAQAIGEGHHFGGDYAGLATRILSFPAPHGGAT